MAEEASSSMSLQCLPSGCCAGRGRPARTAGSEAPEGPGEDCGTGGASIQLRGLDTKQLKGSLVVLYAPAGNNCLLRLVGHAGLGWSDVLCCAVTSQVPRWHFSRFFGGIRSCSSGGRLWKSHSRSRRRGLSRQPLCWFGLRFGLSCMYVEVSPSGALQR